ncbi:MAG: hypothetical protein JO018_04095 [Candidatus Eremiobacteraeota bacterium]|nr:hypothetical protein [Candidatus Eremiobacteraeota bacterium]MBV9402892.1 hypothetical protein [Candidatus Eremiobacteraeota bacterium]
MKLWLEIEEGMDLSFKVPSRICSSYIYGRAKVQYPVSVGRVPTTAVPAGE